MNFDAEKQNLTDMKKTPQVSVVVPIYKVEKYLRQCVDSILAQTLRDIEVILVDDGSPDACPQIVDEYAAKDARVVPVHQPNGGYGNAVNHGVRLARGEYVGIIESDDWIEPTMYEKLYAAAKTAGADLAKCAFYIYDSTKAPNEQNWLWDECRDLMAEAPGGFRPLDRPHFFLYHSSPWSYLYQRALIAKVPVVEAKNIAYQDIPLVKEILARAEHLVIVGEPLLHYRMEEGQGSSCTGNGRKMISVADMCRITGERFRALGVYEPLRNVYFCICARAAIFFYQRIRNDFRREFFVKLRALFAPLQDDADFRYEYFTEDEMRWVKSILENRFEDSCPCGAGNLVGERSFKERLRKIVRLKIRKDFLLVSLFGHEKTFRF